MAKVIAWKIGVGAGSILLGVYFLLGGFDMAAKIFGIVAIAFGIGLIASS